MTTRNEGVRPVREVREKISTEFDQDPQKLVEHYMKMQEQYQDRLVAPTTTQQGDETDDTSRRR